MHDKIYIDLETVTNAKIITAVIGQLSDGTWENGNLDRYWKNANVDGTELIIDRNYNSGFNDKSEKQIKEYFAKKLKQVVQEEVGNNKQGWRRDNTQISDYISYNHDITVSMCYECYDFLKERRRPVDEYGHNMKGI